MSIAAEDMDRLLARVSSLRQDLESPLSADRGGTQPDSNLQQRDSTMDIKSVLARVRAVKNELETHPTYGDDNTLDDSLPDESSGKLVDVESRVLQALERMRVAEMQANEAASKLQNALQQMEVLEDRLQEERNTSSRREESSTKELEVIRSSMHQLEEQNKVKDSKIQQLEERLTSMQQELNQAQDKAAESEIKIRRHKSRARTAGDAAQELNQATSQQAQLWQQLWANEQAHAEGQGHSAA